MPGKANLNSEMRFYSLSRFSTAQPNGVIDERVHSCSPTDGVYAPNSAFATNLDTLINAVIHESPLEGGFYNRSVGISGVDQVNGIGLCRGDLTWSACNVCLRDASQTLRLRCVNEIKAVIWYTECMFRYSDQTILNTKTTSPMWDISNTGNVSDPASFNQQLGTLLRSLRDKAAAGDSLRKYADGSAVVGFQMVYAVVQCTPDLSALDCSDCIDTLITSIPNCCAGRLGAYLLTPSCTLRFEDKQFYDPDANNSNGSTGANNSSSSTGANNHSSNTGKNGSKKGGTPIVAFVILPVICLGVVLFI